MNKLKSKKRRRTMWIILSIIVVIVAGVLIFIHTPQFGSISKGKRLERVHQSSDYREGKFQNISNTPQMTGDSGFFTAMLDFLFKKVDRLKPKNGIPVIKTDLHNLDRNEDVLIWFGHSSCFIQIDKKRILIDPVFSKAASPVSFINKAFKGTEVYTSEDIPDIDYLIISHDHFDHLDYPTIKALKSRTGKVICSLGVGAHFERWGFDKNNIIEMDWNEDTVLSPGFEVFCLPARHFSGRSLSPNQSLWASFLLKMPSFTIYIGGDGGYDTHFASIGERFPTIDLAILENGQYNENWKYIHMLPDQTLKAGKDLQAKRVLPVHNSKFALGQHAWDEPLRKVTALHNEDDFTLITPMIGQIVYLKDSTQTFNHWWIGVE